MSSANERVNGLASGSVLPSCFFAVLNHSALSALDALQNSAGWRMENENMVYPLAVVLLLLWQLLEKSDEVYSFRYVSGDS